MPNAVYHRYFPRDMRQAFAVRPVPEFAPGFDWDYELWYSCMCYRRRLANQVESVPSCANDRLQRTGIDPPTRALTSDSWGRSSASRLRVE